MNDKQEQLGIIAYEAYGDSVGWKSYNDETMQCWADLPQCIQLAWAVAAAKVTRQIRADILRAARTT